MVSEPERMGDWVGDDGLRRPSSSLLLRDTLLHLAGIFVATLVVAMTATLHVPLGWDFVVSAMVITGVIFAFALHALPGHPHRRFGPANVVTAVRAAMVSLTGAAVLFLNQLDQTDIALWTLVGVVLVALAMDGIDGYLARRFGHTSEFGARFDMEVDALLILILSVAAAVLDKAGVWVVLIGLMRYGFVAAQLFMPGLRGELFVSFRRKLACVLQIVALCLVLMPFVEPPYSSGISAIALAMLIYSFGVDIVYLLGQPGRPR
ncbi:CDP-alcohol phosphatidyltransferase family protein [Rhizobium sp. SL42]|uniref:CDP-alcohol phosphatidyltransferase family protein n=1 Tax=Rhizobium sp. SL42 TaxID=2806346 RepID=UPI001F36C600|nr:CDP-alcohol phosphatidyltransferase family protein [Rhizobium sp. SL42]UJW77415.1 CDP-alcohol phosphatidyltransferase family protein [Rhizobium sp. SL42]